MAALLAVALLAFAAVRSVVMQAEAATPWGATEICDIHRTAGGGDPHQAPPAPCAFCVAAAHSPVQCLAAPLHPPSWVRWTPPTTTDPAAAASPIPPTPRARGPPRLSDLSV